MEKQVVVEVGAEGGTITLSRARVGDGGWVFFLGTDESTLAGLLNEEDRAGLTFVSESAAVSSWEDALKLLDRYP